MEILIFKKFLFLYFSFYNFHRIIFLYLAVYQNATFDMNLPHLRNKCCSDL